MEGADPAKNVLHQRSKVQICPMKLAIGGVAVAVVLGYFTLYTKKKPEASAVDVGKVAIGIANPDNTHPRK